MKRIAFARVAQETHALSRGRQSSTAGAGGEAGGVERPAAHQAR